MARPVRGCQTARLKQKGAEEPERDPQWEEQPSTTEGNVIVDNNLEVDYEGSEPEVEPVAQEQKEVVPDAEYAKM